MGFARSRMWTRPCQLVSRNRHVYRSQRIGATAADIGGTLGTPGRARRRAGVPGRRGRAAVQLPALPPGRALLLCLRSVWLDEDVTGLSVLERKRRLRPTVPA